ncbi:MAG: DNA mismatch repair protein MutS [Clostridiales bacterium]|nr:DNA mismatch repair protein MutS [Clostridiales bacterium]
MPISPMMQQYLNIKQKHEHCLLFYRVGDFYEMFFDDAKLASKELELVLTGKDCGLKERAPMCGVPHHAVNAYVQRLIEKGYKVAICEQLTEPTKGKLPVERDVVRIITPGTVADSAMLDEKTNAYILCIYFRGKGAVLAYTDVSTGEFTVSLLIDASKRLRDEVSRIAPRELLTNDEQALSDCIGEVLPVSAIPSVAFDRKNAERELTEHFEAAFSTALGFEDKDIRVNAAGALLKYLRDTQKNALCHITQVSFHQGLETMLLDRTTRRNLELTETMRAGERKGSLLWLLDRTRTAMGARLLKAWVEEPLISKERIETRLNAVEAFKDELLTADELAEALENVSDLERLLSKLSYQSFSARDSLALMRSLHSVKPIREKLRKFSVSGIEALWHTLAPLDALCELIGRAIHPDAPPAITEGGIIADGYSEELDEYRNAALHGKQWLMELEGKEREATGIKNLKIQYNRVFGYYLEVTKSNLNLVPDRYIRRQTLANAERYITGELSEIERKITGAQQSAIALETQLFTDIRTQIEKEIPAIQQNALALKTLDVLLSLAKVARDYGYVKPEILENGILDIKNGRHPIVEQTLKDEPFVPNDTLMDKGEHRMLIITGPNMAGKSTYMRQAAQIVALAQIGSFVPADSAKIGICDRIFTRVGAADDLAGGQSTFMVEMSETANILRNATADSLIILDEIGRGTSTFDGLSIAWAVVEYILDRKKVGAKTLFATHYHELSELEGRYEGVKNYCITVKEHGEDVIFLRKIVPGGADKSYGVHVARIAGIPPRVVARAHEIQARLEVSDINQETISQNILETNKKKDRQTDLFHLKHEELVEELQAMDVNAMTPMEALNHLYRLREKARKL